MNLSPQTENFSPYCSLISFGNSKSNNRELIYQNLLKQSKILLGDNIDENYYRFSMEKAPEFGSKYIIGAFALSAGAAGLAYSLKTGHGQKGINKVLNWVDTSENITAKAIRKIFSKGKLKVENIGKKALEHMYTAIDNKEGLGKNGVSGAHTLSAFIKSFFKSEIKDNIQVTNIKMKDKKIKDGNIIIEYIEDGVKQVLETNIGEGFTKGQQKLLRNLCDPKANNGFSIKNFTKSKFYKTYLEEGTEIKGSKNRFYDIYKTLFCEKPTGVIDSIKKDPYIDGIYSIKYHKLTGGDSYPEKTIFMDRAISPKAFRDFESLCSNKVNKPIIREIKNGKKLYNSDNLITTVETALRRGVLKETEKGETIILGQRAGTIFVAYCDKTPFNSYEVRSFFPVLHGSKMHSNLMADYLKNKKQLSIFDIPKLIGLKNEMSSKLCDDFKATVFKNSAIGASLLTSTQTMHEYKKEKKNSERQKI